MISMLKIQDCSVRKIEKKDIETIFEWRNSIRVRQFMFNDRLITWNEHGEWFNKVIQSEKDVYLIFENKKIPTGLVCFTDIDFNNDISDWGFYIGIENPPQGIGMYMGFLGLEFAFKQLDIRKVYARVMSFNKKSIRFHMKLGFEEEGLFREHLLRNGKYEDIIIFSLFNSKWMERSRSMEEYLFFQNKEEVL